MQQDVKSSEQNRQPKEPGFHQNVLYSLKEITLFVGKKFQNNPLNPLPLKTV
jgi:hypothetical protein